MQMTNNLNNDPNESLAHTLQHIDNWMLLLTQRIQFLVVDSEESDKMKISERELALDRHITLAENLLSKRQKYVMQLAGNKEQERAVLMQTLIAAGKERGETRAQP